MKAILILTALLLSMNSFAFTCPDLVQDTDSGAVTDGVRTVSAAALLKYQARGCNITPKEESLKEYEGKIIAKANEAIAKKIAKFKRQRALR